MTIYGNGSRSHIWSLDLASSSPEVGVKVVSVGPGVRRGVCCAPGVGDPETASSCEFATEMPGVQVCRWREGARDWAGRWVGRGARGAAGRGWLVRQGEGDRQWEGKLTGKALCVRWDGGGRGSARPQGGPGGQPRPSTQPRVPLQPLQSLLSSPRATCVHVHVCAWGVPDQGLLSRGGSGGGRSVPASRCSSGPSSPRRV